MNNWVYTQIGICIITTIIASCGILLNKDYKIKTKIGFIIAFVILLGIQIAAIWLNISEQNKKEQKDNTRHTSDSLQINGLKTEVKNSRDTISLKENSIEAFMKMYIVRDSIMKYKYDSINKVTTEVGRPILRMRKITIYKLNTVYYRFKIDFENTGKRMATNVSLKAFIFSNLYNNLDTIHSTDIPIDKKDMFGTKPNGTNLYCEVQIPTEVNFTKDDFIYGISLYIIGTYQDAFTKKEYPFSCIYCADLDNYGKESSPLTTCFPSTLKKVEAFLFPKSK